MFAFNCVLSVSRASMRAERHWEKPAPGSFTAAISFARAAHSEAGSADAGIAANIRSICMRCLMFLVPQDPKHEAESSRNAAFKFDFLHDDP